MVVSNILFGIVGTLNRCDLVEKVIDDHGNDDDDNDDDDDGDDDLSVNY